VKDTPQTEPEVEEVQAAIHELAEVTDVLEARKGEIAEAVQAELDAKEDEDEEVLGGLLRTELAADEDEVGVKDEDVEVGTEESPQLPESPASKMCVACHMVTTQMDANQCPMCGNPFMP